MNCASVVGEARSDHLISQRTYGHNFRACLEAMEIDEVLTAPQSPWQNPYVDRLIGSMRRECVDHVIALIPSISLPQAPL